MKRFIAFVVFAFPFMVSAQKTKQDLSKDIASTDRKEILEAIKTRLQPDLKLKPKLVVRSIWVKNGFAYFIGNAKDSRGKEIISARQRLRTQWKPGYSMVIIRMLC